MERHAKAADKHATPCPVCKTARPRMDLMPGQLVRPVGLTDLIQKENPSWEPSQDVCSACLSRARRHFVEKSISEEIPRLGEAELDVLEALRNHEMIAPSLRDVRDRDTFGDRVADRIAAVGGSWTFIIAFVVVLIGWIALNSSSLLAHSFDPYPYILLNLVLSCLAALQAPVIMMSQNRQASKDRMQADADYKTNLKAELEIRHLHLKVDQILNHQWHRILEIQQIQTDMLSELRSRTSRERT